MPDLNDLALRAAALKALLDRVQDAYDDAKNTLAEVLGPEGRRNALLDGYKIASVSVTKAGRVSVDEPTLSAWVAEHRPTEVVIRPVIRPAYLAQIRKHTAETGIPMLPDGELDIPGVHVGEPYPSVRFADGGRALVAQLWAAGRIDLETGKIKEIEK